jgi:outer membrane receptor protein involved in Fe transport
MKNFSIKFHLLTMSFLLALSTIAFAQETGQINGTVKDQNGGLVAGATVKVKNNGTNAERNTTTNSSGYFAVTNLLPGSYEVEINATGFKGQKVPATVTIGGSTTQNVDLNVSGTVDTVDIVSTGVAEVNTTDQQQSTIVTGKQITSLPILNNNPYNLAVLAPNVTDNDPGGNGVGVAINGQRSASTSILMDGVENSNVFSATVGQSIPQDAVGEFRIVTNSFSAEYGRASGGIVSVSTKGGTNKFIGNAFAQNRNSALSSNGYARNATGQDRVNYNRNQDGITFSGPVVKDKLFFLNSFQSTRVRSKGSVLAWVPSAALIASTAANTRAFFAAYGTLKATPTGQVDANRFQLVKYEAPINGGGGTPLNDINNVSRIDWTVSDKTSLFGSWKYNKTDNLPGTATNSPYKGYDGSTKGVGHIFQGSFTHLFTSNVIFDAKVAYTRGVGKVSLSQSAATPTLYLFQAFGATNDDQDGSPYALPGFAPFSPGGGLPIFGTQQILDAKPNLSWTTGNHSFRFGAQYVFIQDKEHFGAYEGASYFLSAGASLTTALANLVAGNAQLLNVAIDPQGKTPGGTINLPVKSPNFERTNRFQEYGLYALDNWRVFSNLTLNLGLRYEYNGPQKSKEGLDSNFFLGSGSNIYQQIRNGGVKVASTNGGLWKPDRNNFAPRLGFAWDITGDGKTSLRGGYGVGYERNFGNVTFNVIQNPPFYAVLSVPSPISVNNFGALAASSGTATLPRSSLRYVREDIRNAYAHQWSLSLQREIAKSTTINIEYAGSAGRKGYTLENINRSGTGPRFLGSNTSTTCPTGIAANNRLNCQFSNINTRGNNGYNNNNSVSTSLESNNLFSTGLATVFRYTYAVNRDNLSSTFSSSSNNFNLGLLDPFNPSLDYGYSDYDTRHRFVGSIIYPIPFKLENGAANAVLGGWNLSTVITMQSGAPFTIFDCTNASATTCIRLQNGSSLTYNGTRVEAGANNFNFIDLSRVKVTTFSDVSGGTEVGPFPSNVQRRNSYRGPGRWNVDASVFKIFNLTERYKLQVRADAFNIFNHADLFINGSSADVSANLIFDADGNVIGNNSSVKAFKSGIRFAQVELRFTF